MDVKQIAEQFWRDGYVVIEDFYSAELMDHMNGSILKHFGETPDFSHTDEFVVKSKVEIVPWFPQREGNLDFDAAANDDRLSRLTAELIGEEWEEHYCMVMFSKQGTRGQAWHQDCPPEDSSLFNLNRLIYTHDITPELGGQTVVMPGTHKVGLLPAGDPEGEMEGAIVLEPKKGTLVLLHGHCWHRVLPVKGQYRVSTNYRSSPEGVPGNITDVCVYRNMRYRFSTSEVVEDRTVQASA